MPLPRAYVFFRVRDAIMFGREHEQAGVLIETTSEYAIDPSDLTQLAALRNKLWSVHYTICSALAIA
jgi:hypothetical protein